jgi:hypothetical protein
MTIPLVGVLVPAALLWLVPWCVWLIRLNDKSIGRVACEQRPDEVWNVMAIREYSAGSLLLIRTEISGTWLVQAIPHDRNVPPRMWQSLSERHARDTFAHVM